MKRIVGPLLTVGTKGNWDENCAGFGSIIKVDDSYRMYYSGQRGKYLNIGIAESKDGIRWNKYNDNPILTGDKGSWDEKRCDLPTVWLENNEYKMIYRGVSEDNKVRVGLAVSDDGFNWVKYSGNPVFDDTNQWAKSHNEPYGIIKYNDIYVMFYSNLYPNDIGTPKEKIVRSEKGREIGCAISKDLINWEPISDKPIFKCPGDKSEWNYAQFCPYVFHYSKNYYILIVNRSLVSPNTNLALYKCRDPFFREQDRQFLGVVVESVNLCIDTPFIITDDIYREVRPEEGEITVYYTAGPSHSLETYIITIPVSALK